MTQHMDFLGNVIEIGDTVAFVRKDYRDMIKGVVKRFTPQQIVIEYQVHWTKDEYLDEYRIYPTNVIVIAKKEVSL